MLKKIARIVSEMKRWDKPIALTISAASLFAEFPHANLSITRIKEEISHAAKEAGVQVDCK